jgi:hypothetical protein
MGSNRNINVESTILAINVESTNSKKKKVLVNQKKDNGGNLKQDLGVYNSLKRDFRKPTKITNGRLCTEYKLV